MTLDLQLYLSEEEYLLQRRRQNTRTGDNTQTAITNFSLFSKDVLKIDYHDIINELRGMTDFRTQESKALILLQKFINWLAVDHLELFRPCGSQSPLPVKKKDVDTIKSYVVQIRLYFRKVGGIRITSEDMKDFVTYPEPVEKEEKEPLTTAQLRKICRNASPKRALLYRIKKDCEARIGSMVQLRVKNFDISKRPIEVFFQKGIMKKKNGVSYSNTKYVTKEDESDLLEYLATFDDPEALVWGTNENPLTALHAEERYWARLVSSKKVGLGDRYKHSGFLKISLHTIKSFTFTAAEKAVSETYAHAYGDHWRYTKNYLRWSEEDKIAKFRAMEPLLSLYTEYERVTDEDLIKENSTLTQKLSESEELLETITTKTKDATKVVVDEKTRVLFMTLLKENNLI